MGVGEQRGERELGKKRLFTQIAPLRVSNQRTGGGKSLQRDPGDIFSVHLISRASWVLTSKECSNAGAWRAAALRHAGTDCGLWKLTSEQRSPGQGWASKGRSGWLYCGDGEHRQADGKSTTRKQASLKERLLPSPRGRSAPSLGNLPGFLPSVAANLHAHPALNPSILGFSGRQQPEREWCFILFRVNIFTFCEHTGARLLNAHVFSISWYLAVLWDCPQSPL